MKGKANNWKGHSWAHQQQAEQLPTLDTSFITPRMLSSLCVGMLPTVLPHVANHDLQTLGNRFQALLFHKPLLRKVVESLQPLIAKAEGLQHCSESLAAALEGSPESAGQFVLTFLTGLDLLPFEQRIAFFEALARTHWETIEKAISKTEKLWPAAFDLLQHHDVICDNCGASPIKGPRFKSQTHPDYDLCSECFANRSVHGNECADDQFQCIVMNGGQCPWKSVWKLFKGNAKGQWCKGMWKGHGKCGKGWQHEQWAGWPWGYGKDHDEEEKSGEAADVNLDNGNSGKGKAKAKWCKAKAKWRKMVQK